MKQKQTNKQTKQAKENKMKNLRKTRNLKWIQLDIENQTRQQQPQPKNVTKNEIVR